MTIQDIFEVEGRSGPVVTGKVEEGIVRVGDELVLTSGGNTVTVRVVAIEKFKHAGVRVAEAGPNDIGLELSGVAYSEVEIGSLLTSRALHYH